MFSDKSEIILATEIQTLAYIDKTGESNTYNFESALENSSSDLASRLKLLKDIMGMMDKHKAEPLAERNKEFKFH